MIRRVPFVLSLITACGIAVAVALPPGTIAAHDIRQERVSFDTGASSTTLNGSMTSDETVDYILGAKAGQAMSVRFTPTNLSSYVNVYPPGSQTALLVGSVAGNRWMGTLPADGDYTVRVYMMRNAARRNETSDYTLDIAISGAAGGVKVTGTPYHANGTVGCSIGPDPKGSSQCAFGVIRGAPGNAEVHVTSPGGEDRILTFAGSAVTIDDASARLTSERQGDQWSIGINDFEYYVIPDAVIDGG